MRRMFLNLISTMLSLKPAAIRITLTEVSTGLDILVCAMGRELSPPELSRMQESFDTSTMMDKNTCALAVCQLVASAHHWSLYFENLSGVGFQSRLSVPVEDYLLSLVSLD